jgi:D-alanine--poly(phosphoribitol) ligase subunit 2
MDEKETIIQTIYGVVDEINLQQPDNGQLEKSLDTVLFGQNGKLDSLGLVNFVVAAEQNIEEALGVSVSVSDERAMSQKNSPFRTIGTLIDYICILLTEAKDA